MSSQKLKFEVMDGSTPSSARVEGRSRYFAMFLGLGQIKEVTQHNSLLRNWVTKTIGVTFTFLANVVWVQPCKYRSELINGIKVPNAPLARNGTESSFSQKSRVAPQLNASYWLMHDSRVHFWHRGSYVQHQRVILTSVGVLTTCFIRTHVLYHP